MLKRFLFKTSKPLTSLSKPPFSPLYYKFSTQPGDPQKGDDIRVHEVKGEVRNKEEDEKIKPYLVTGGTKADENECLIDVDKFNTKQYLKVLLNPTTPPDPKNFFPFWVLTTYFGIGFYYLIFWARKAMGREKPRIVMDQSLKDAAQKGQAEGAMFGLGERKSVKYDFKKFETERDKLIRGIADV